MYESFKIELAHDPADPALNSIVARSDEYLRALYPPESNHTESIETLMGSDSSLFLGYLHHELVACGAIKFVESDPSYGEIKRLFVVESCRGRGLAMAMMRHLEQFATEQGWRLIRLEAGPLQPKALRLYRKLGYVDRAPFGRYADDPLSVFMEKRLSD